MARSTQRLFASVFVIAQLATAVAQGPTQSNFDELSAKGRAAVQSGDLDSAEVAFHEALALNPNSAATYGDLGIVAIRRQQWPAALSALKKAHDLAPSAPVIATNLALAYYRTDEARAAIPLLESVLREQPASIGARYLLGLCYLSAERYPEAVAVLDQLWDQKSGDADYLFAVSFSSSLAGRAEVESRARSQFLKKYGEAQYHFMLGQAYAQVQQYHRAVTEYQAAMRVNPNLPLLHSALGMAYFWQQDFTNAETELLRDRDLEPDVAVNYDRLGMLYFYLQKFDKAKENYEKALRLDPKMASAYYGLARIYQKQQKYEEALNAIGKAQKTDPGNPHFSYLKGQILMRLGRTQEAQAELQSASRSNQASRERRRDPLIEAPAPQE